MTDQREAVARIIAQTDDAFVESYLGVGDISDICARASPGWLLAIADAILSTLGSQAVEPERDHGGDANDMIEPERERDVARLRAALIDMGRQIPGCALSDEVSTDFLMLLPEEMRAWQAKSATLPASLIRRRAEEVIELHDPRVIELAGKLFKAEHPNSEWSPGRAAICWFVRAETALNALASAPKASDGESGRG